MPVTEVDEWRVPLLDELVAEPFVMDLWSAARPPAKLRSRHAEGSVFTAGVEPVFWIETVGSGIYEGRRPERGHERMSWRSNSPRAVVLELVRGAPRGGSLDRLAPGCPLHPEGFRFEDGDEGSCRVVRGAPAGDEWFETFFGVEDALAFALLWAAPFPSVRLRAQLGAAGPGGHPIRGRCLSRLSPSSVPDVQRLEMEPCVARGGSGGEERVGRRGAGRAARSESGGEERVGRRGAGRAARSGSAGARRVGRRTAGRAAAVESSCTSGGSARPSHRAALRSSRVSGHGLAWQGAR